MDEFMSRDDETHKRAWDQHMEYHQLMRIKVLVDLWEGAPLQRPNSSLWPTDEKAWQRARRRAYRRVRHAIFLGGKELWAEIQALEGQVPDDPTRGK